MIEREPDFFDVMTCSYEYEILHFRFPGDEKGFSRAVSYMRNYNAALREALGVSNEDVDLPSPSPYDHQISDETRGRMRRAQEYRSHSAEVAAAYAVPVIGNDEPLPTEYSFDF